MLKFLLSTFYYKNFIYTTYSTRDDILDKLGILFTEKKRIFTSPNLTGESVNFPYGFEIKPKWSIGVYKGFEQSPAYLKGTISETINNKTKI